MAILTAIFLAILMARKTRAYEQAAILLRVSVIFAAIFSASYEIQSMFTAAVLLTQAWLNEVVAIT